MTSPTEQRRAFDAAINRYKSGDPAAAREPGAAVEVAPISGSPADRAPDGWEGEPPLTAYVDHTATDVPLPATPPEDEGMPPPPVDTGRPAATVDPITDR